MGFGLVGTPCESGELSGTEDLCLLIRVSQVRDLYGLLSTPSPSADIFFFFFLLLATGCQDAPLLPFAKHERRCTEFMQDLLCCHFKVSLIEPLTS